MGVVYTEEVGPALRILHAYVLPYQESQIKMYMASFLFHCQEDIKRNIPVCVTLALQGSWETVATLLTLFLAR